MRLLHTSDWHLGHALHDHPRTAEHAAFLSWLSAQLQLHHVDALLITGDIFDSANPSAEAQSAWYRFIASTRLSLPHLQIVVIGGNHDSPARLDAPEALFQSLGVTVVGGLAGAHHLDRCVVPLRDAQGAIAAWVGAVPFLRPADLPLSGDETSDRLIEGVRLLYARVLELLRAKRSPGQALLAMGHCYVAGGKLSELSERKILGGNQHALPSDLFPAELAYVALGHLHLAQKVGGREGLRYAGSPLPLSLSEAGYVHQVCLVELEGEALTGVRSIPVPRTVAIVRIPARDAAPIDAVLAELAELPERNPHEPQDLFPYLEVVIALEKPEPGLRNRVMEALEHKAVRLVRLGVAHTGNALPLAGQLAPLSLRELEPEEVFRRLYARDHQGEPEPALLEAFHELVDAANQERR